MTAGSPTPDSSWGTELTRPRYPSVSRIEGVLWGFAVVAMVADLAATVHGLGLGLRELNPVARSLLDSAGLMGFVWLKAGAFGVAVACRSIVPDWLGAIVPAALGIPWMVAAVLNAATILTVP